MDENNSMHSPRSGSGCGFPIRLDSSYRAVPVGLSQETRQAIYESVSCLLFAQAMNEKNVKLIHCQRQLERRTFKDMLSQRSDRRASVSCMYGFAPLFLKILKKSLDSKYDS